MEVCNPIDDALPVMWVSSVPKDKIKGRIKHNDIFKDHDNNGATSTSPGLSAVCPIIKSSAETTTPTITELVTQKDKDAFCRQVADTVRATRLMLLLRPSWRLGSHCPTLQCHTDRDTKLAQTTPPLSVTLSTTGGTPHTTVRVACTTL